MLPFTYKRLPVNTNSTYTLSVSKSHLETILYYDVQSKNKRRKKTPTNTDIFRDSKINGQKVEPVNV